MLFYLSSVALVRIRCQANLDSNEKAKIWGHGSLKEILVIKN